MSVETNQIFCSGCGRGNSQGLGEVFRLGGGTWHGKCFKHANKALLSQSDKDFPTRINSWEDYIRFRHWCRERFEFSFRARKFLVWLDFNHKSKFIEFKTGKKGETEQMNVLIPFVIRGFNLRYPGGHYIYLTLDVEFQE